jgi:hypothetical protein
VTRERRRLLFRQRVPGLEVVEHEIELRAELLEHFQLGSVKGWLHGALTGKRSRSHAIPSKSNIPGKKMYVFPDQVTQRVILVVRPGEQGEQPPTFTIQAPGRGPVLAVYDVEF